jgi:hypothetical protein
LLDIGNVYQRKLLIHGARVAVLRIKRDRTSIGPWLDRLDASAPKRRRGCHGEQAGTHRMGRPLERRRLSTTTKRLSSLNWQAQ